ncbi:outer membrane lipoprotein carrier protein LolA [Vibrio chemaguriensis]|uniref:outer membrane lipoprotein carrier protein LolA n=1 Tax=Vibrio chemaguriensis TaxID=2527672 RepID=UPI001CDD5AFC|nr:outer membrane lipoprotein carrier protein LolA [Vibrio chemaguriensis]MCA2415792.1 outer membrane lipoprotein carrier protein LolA [Vibrio chemaguriensis]MCA2426705.1 outer membrane lipoprotein carrier protein LolA [Vibrio chemaguriensis]
MQKWLLSFLLIFSVPALATPTANITDLASLQQQLSQHEIVRGDFTQQRHLEMFSQPLTSKGQFTLSKTHGLLWQQTEPFAVNLVLTENKLRQTFADQAPKTISAQENPMAFYFSHVFLSVFHGDTSALQEQFTLDFSVENNQWQLILEPKQSPLNAVFKAITLSGKAHIDRLTLQELRGDKTEITFTNQTSLPQELMDAEVAQFRF